MAGNLMKKASIIKLVATLGVLIILLIIVMSVPKWRWSFLSVVSSKPVCRECGYLHVNHDYYEATGISRDTLGATPAEVVDICGEPDYIYEENMGEGAIRIVYSYGNFGIIFSTIILAEENVEDSTGFGIVLYSPNLKIRHDIHVGSTREQIIHAYRKCPTMTEQYAEVNDEELGDSVLDVGYKNASRNYLQFVYDENDIVTSIEYYPGSRYE